MVQGGLLSINITVIIMDPLRPTTDYNRYIQVLSREGEMSTDHGLSLQLLMQQQIRPRSEPPTWEERDTLRSEFLSSETTTDAARTVSPSYSDKAD